MTYSEKCRLARIIAKYMTAEGTLMTQSGSYFFSFSEINQLFGTSLPDDEDMVEKISDALDTEIVADVIIDEGFDLDFYLAHCLCVENTETDEVQAAQI